MSAVSYAAVAALALTIGARRWPGKPTVLPD